MTELESFVHERLGAAAFEQLPILLSKVRAILQSPPTIPAGERKQGVEEIHRAARVLQTALEKHLPGLKQALGHDKPFSFDSETAKQVEALSKLACIDALVEMIANRGIFASTPTGRPAKDDVQIALTECKTFFQYWRGKNFKLFAELVFMDCQQPVSEHQIKQTIKGGNLKR